MARRLTMFLCALLLGLLRPGLAESDLAGVSAPATDSTYSDLGERVRKQINTQDWGGGTVSVLVEDAELPIRAVAINENQLMQPAGLEQIVTAAAALDRLGLGFTFKTDLGFIGKIDDGVLSGSLVVRGDGDPSVSGLFLKRPDQAMRLFDDWASRLRARGIRRVTGDVIGDAAAFDNEWHAPGWPLQMLGEPYLPSISALNYNHNCIDVFWHAGRTPGRLAECEIFPELPKFVFFADHVALAPPSGTGSDYGLPLVRRYERGAESDVINATGRLPIKTEAHDRATIDNPARFFAEALRSRLIERKLAIMGKAVSSYDLADDDQPGNVQVVATHKSPPLRDLLARMMSYDLALEAEVVFKTMGRHEAGRPGSFAMGQRAVERFLAAQHLPGQTPVLMDGSGRSDLDRISAAQLARLMQLMIAKSQVGSDFTSLFPPVGSAGALEGRFSQLKLPKRHWWNWGKGPSPRLWVKPGSAPGGVEGLAGLAETATGRRLVFVMMINGSKAPASALREQLDRVAVGLTR